MLGWSYPQLPPLQDLAFRQSLFVDHPSVFLRVSVHEQAPARFGCPLILGNPPFLLDPVKAVHLAHC